MTWTRFYNTYLMAPVVYLHNRFVVPSDRVMIRHPEFGKGRYHDLDYIMLYALFQMIVDYVEIECSCMNRLSKTISFETRGQKIIRVLRELPIIHWYVPPVRNARQGLHHLRWMTSLKDAPQSQKFAADVLRLYSFWKHERPRRTDPYASWHQAREGKDWRSKATPAEDALFDKAVKLEDKYERQDEQMLHLIITIRNSLWT